MLRYCCHREKVYSDIHVGPFKCTLRASLLKIQHVHVPPVKHNKCIAFPYRISKKYHLGLRIIFTIFYPEIIAISTTHKVFRCNLACVNILWYYFRGVWLYWCDCYIVQWILVHFVLYHSRVNNNKQIVQFTFKNLLFVLGRIQENIYMCGVTSNLTMAHYCKYITIG